MKHEIWPPLVAFSEITLRKMRSYPASNNTLDCPDLVANRTRSNVSCASRNIANLLNCFFANFHIQMDPGKLQKLLRGIHVELFNLCHSSHFFNKLRTRPQLLSPLRFNGPPPILLVIIRKKYQATHLFLFRSSQQLLPQKQVPIFRFINNSTVRIGGGITFFLPVHVTRRNTRLKPNCGLFGDGTYLLRSRRRADAFPNQGVNLVSQRIFVLDVALLFLQLAKLRQELCDRWL